MKDHNLVNLLLRLAVLEEMAAQLEARDKVANGDDFVYTDNLGRDLNYDPIDPSQPIFWTADGRPVNMPLGANVVRLADFEHHRHRKGFTISDGFTATVTPFRKG